MRPASLSRTLLGLFATLAPVSALSAQLPVSATNAAAAAAPADGTAADSTAAASRSQRSVAPWAGYGDSGVMVGATASWTRGGFGAAPFAGRDRVRLEYAPLETRFALDYARTTHYSGGRMLTVHARASQVEELAFYGWGNETDGSGPRDDYRAQQDALTLEAELSRPLAAGVRLGVGPVFRYRAPSVEEGTPLATLAPLGDEAYATGGIRTSLSWDGRDEADVPARGGWLRLTGEAHQGLDGEVDETFARMRGEGAAYVPVAPAVTLALRSGAERVWGAFPVQEAAFLGGQGSLRGQPRGRFAGDASVWSNAELRTGLGRADLRVVRGEAGALLLADAGRVFVDGESEGGWHTAYGAGVYFATEDRALTTTLLAARGEDGWRAYLRVGLPF